MRDFLPPAAALALEAGRRVMSLLDAPLVESRKSDNSLVTNADHAVGCAICDVLATAGHTTLPIAHDVVVETIASNDATALAIRRAPRALTHSWQSRAPPIAL